MYEITLIYLKVYLIIRSSKELMHLSNKNEIFIDSTKSISINSKKVL